MAKSSEKFSGAKNAAKAAEEIKIYKPKENKDRAYGYEHEDEKMPPAKSMAQCAHDEKGKK